MKANKTFILLLILILILIFIILSINYFLIILLNLTFWGGNVMFVEERRHKIIELLSKKEKITVNELKKQFSVSDVTIRKDLNDLEKQNLLTRTHGGAIINDSVIDVPTIYKRKVINKRIKEEIGEKAANFVEDGQTIMLDSGTTTFEVAKNLNKDDLLIISNSLEICNNLIQENGVDVIITGGRIDKENLSIHGKNSENLIKNYNADIFFMGLSALSLEKGFTTSEERTANIKRLMMDSAKKVIVVSDSSKFGKISFSSICDFDAIDLIITDNNIETEYIEAFNKADIDLYTVEA